MLPRVQPGILSSNPVFESVYNDLCTNKLNPDGTSKLDEKTQRERDAFAAELRQKRVEAAKLEVAKSELSNLSYRPDELTPELQELAGVIILLLDGQTSAEERGILMGYLTKHNNNVDTIITRLSTILQQNAEALATLLDPSNPSTISNIPGTIQKIKQEIAILNLKLSKARYDITDKAAENSNLQRQIVANSIRILEQTIHGSVARGAKAHAEYLAQVADGLSKKLSSQHAQITSQFLTTEVQDMVRRKKEQLERDNRQTVRQVRELEEKLEKYKKSSGVGEIAAEYAEILKEIEKVEGEIVRLQS